MSVQIADRPTPPSKTAAELPHGLLTPPPRVLELLEQEAAKHPPGVFAKCYEFYRNYWTVDCAFDGTYYEVIYRETPQGPEVLAVGFEECFALKKSLPLEEQRTLKTRTGY